jgi:aldehyde dehydrogenase
MSYLDLGKQEGAEVLAGGGQAIWAATWKAAIYVQPTLFKGHNKMRIFQKKSLARCWP